jgi:nitrogenase molybdenum-iron protein beta chain
MMPIFTTCMPEIIGDDLSSFIKNARQKGHIPEDFPLPYANTPSFNGSHTHGYDAMLKAILAYLTEGQKVEGACTGKLNLIPGFDACTGNYREYKRILDAMDVPHTILADISEVFDSPLEGTYHPYPGGTKLDDARESINGKATISLQKWSTRDTMKFVNQEYAGANEVMAMPVGVQNTDAFLLKVSELFDKPVPESLKAMPTSTCTTRSSPSTAIRTTCWP